MYKALELQGVIGYPFQSAIAVQVSPLLHRLSNPFDAARDCDYEAANRHDYDEAKNAERAVVRIDNFLGPGRY